ncbi:S9 family peptidase [Halioglobus pacificus]|uniref:Acylaminoacyl-peptidase n=1 Tax=Parahalioglobus pacificus TaxID=930806 RepID=A0A919CK77_9GAMM|nr:S9 family peptidase [Halioglobus pacificus]GHD32852.1 acylaminoacyl-peptidase [Halioglobus pacificus]
MSIRLRFLCLLLVATAPVVASSNADPTVFQREDVFGLQWVSKPQISPDGQRIVYERKSMDIMKDRRVGRLWLVGADGENHVPLDSGSSGQGGAQWSPAGDRIAFIADGQIHVHWLEGSKSAAITQLTESPSSMSWSPDGSRIAFSMLVPEAPPVLVKPLKKPEGAEWPDAPSVTTALRYERDGAGRLEPGYSHLFVVDADGGPARQVTSGDYHHTGQAQWLADGSGLVFSANRHPEWEHQIRESELYQLDIASGEIQALTARKGPDAGPVVSPDGRYVAWNGYDDKVQAFQVTQLYVMDLDDGEPRALNATLDRSVSGLQWAGNSKGVYYLYSDKGETRVGFTSLSDKSRDVARKVGGESMARPYSGGSYSVSRNGTVAFSLSEPSRPAELAIATGSADKARTVIALNENLLAHRTLGEVEEVWYSSSIDGLDLQGWIIKPPNYEEGKAYPLLVENHGGPIAHYGPHFTPELQLFAAHGYLVFYPNPRGSTSYGEAFANLLFNNYPGEDYQDVMDGADYLIDKGLTSEDRLYVTGGSAGGIMTAWIVGKNNRFQAAAVIKPVMNWISKLLTADNYFYYADYRYPGQVWENPENYWKSSPVSLVGNIQTPTMVMVGSNDLRTPLSEAKQLYHALKLRQIDTALVEVPEAPHFIGNRPSQLITKVDHILAWFEKYPWNTSGEDDGQEATR